MRKIFIVILIVLVSAMAMALYQNNPQNILAKIKLAQLTTPARQFDFKIYLFGVLPVGKAVIEDRGNEDGFRHLSARAEATGIVLAVYPFSAKIDSYLDPDLLLPLIFRQEMKVKDKELIKEITYNQQNNVMETLGVKRSILPETYEPLSAMLKIRSLDLERSATFDLNINTNQKNYAFEGTINKQNMRLNDGKIQLFRLSGKIFRRDKNPYHQSQIDIVLADGKEKLPILIKIFSAGMSIVVRLTDVR